MGSEIDYVCIHVSRIFRVKQCRILIFVLASEVCCLITCSVESSGRNDIAAAVARLKVEDLQYQLAEEWVDIVCAEKRAEG